MQNKRKDIAESIANNFNYQLITLDCNDEIVKAQSSLTTNEQVKTKIDQVPKHFRGIVVDGYPFNFETAIFAQQNGYLPDRIFILESSVNDSEAHYKVIYADSEVNVERAIVRDELNLKELK